MKIYNYFYFTLLFVALLSCEEPKENEILPPKKPQNCIGSACFKESFTIPTANAAPVFEIGASDFDNDGDTDVLLISELDETFVHLYTNNGDNTFEVKELAVFGIMNSSELIIADFDNNGDKDFAFIGLGDIIRFSNNGGVFSYVKHNFNHVSFLTILDFDGDQDLDFIGVEEDYTAYWFEQNGNNYIEHNFHPQQQGIIQDVILMNLDNDEDLELVLADYSDNKIEYLNKEGNQYVKHLFAENLSSGPWKITSGNINGDNKEDIIYADWTSIGYIDNFFPEYKDHIVAQNTGSNIFVEDIDGNGAVDILCPKADMGLFVYENNGKGEFTQTLISDKQLFNYVIIDFDNDGDLDILGATFGFSPSIVLLENSML